MGIFFTSDLHFGHANIIKYCNRPFDSVEHMNRELIARWNSVVTEDDKVIVLGDFAMGKIAETLPMAERLNGYKFLVPGNHDRCFGGSPKAERQVARYQEVGFHVLPEKYMLSIAGIPTMLCHFPYSVNAYDERFRDKHPHDLGGRLLSGHVHDAWKMQKRNINVGSDVWDYTPVHEDELVKLFESGE